MGHSKTLKLVTLTCFICLISAFIAYRAGIFDRQAENRDLPEADMDAKENSTDPGTVTETDSANAASAAMMSSSKSVILLEPDRGPANLKKKKESPKETIPPEPEPLLDENINLMSSSKSAVIFRPGKSSSNPNDPKPTDNNIIRSQSPVIFGKKQAADTLKNPEQ